MHANEFKMLRSTLKQARESLASSPRDLREQRELEVNRLELALKKAESTVNKEKLDKVEDEALNKFAKEEREKRKDGKGGWWMKRC
jgi:ribosomal RNA-processing protein 36